MWRAGREGVAVVGGLGEGSVQRRDLDSSARKPPRFPLLTRFAARAGSALPQVKGGREGAGRILRAGCNRWAVPATNCREALWAACCWGGVAMRVGSLQRQGKSSILP